METLLMPGLDGTGRMFAPIERLLAPEIGARVVAYPRDRVLDYDELLEAIDVPPGPFALVGESFSGPLSIRLAARYPDRVRALVLVATFVRSPLLARAGALLPVSLIGKPLPDAMMRLGLVGPHAGRDLIEEIRSATTSVDPRVFRSRLRSIAAVDVSRDLAATSVPAMYIGGAHDRLVTRRDRMRAKAARPNMEVHVLDAPHMVLQCKPSESAALISSFVKKQQSRAPH